MASHEFCKLERRERILVITINRPEVMNAVHPPANRELAQAFDAFAADPELWVAVLTGAGDKAFCAGNDLKFQAAGNDMTQPAAGFGGLTGRFDLQKPVIAAVNGLAMGGGFEIALACDLIVASENAFFALPEPRVGLAASAGGLVRLPREIPLKKAMGIILAGKRVSAREGLAYGFVNEVVPPGEALDGALLWAAEILQGSPLSIRASKEMVAKTRDLEGIGALYRAQKTFPAMKALYESEDRIEGPKAFAEKRKSNWKGR